MSNYPESPREAARRFTPELTELVNSPLYSEVWTDERLSPHDRSIATLAALEYSAVAIRNYHDAGNTTNVRTTLAVLAACLDRLGRYAPAATIAGFAFNPFTTAVVLEFNTAIAHLRDVLGDQTYESLARKGETMTTATMVTYAYDQIDQARTELERP